MLWIHAEAIPGTAIESAAREAVEVARHLAGRFNVELTFNGTTVPVRADDTAEAVIRRYRAAR